ncbi:MAG: transposase [Parachlamydiaceae bacterium]
MSNYLFEMPARENQKIDTPKEKITGKKHIRSANRSQVEYITRSLDQLIPEDHRVRDVWEYVCSLDLRKFYEDIRVPEGGQGPATADPKVLLALWLFALLEGVSSARQIDRLCREHQAYIWLCGGMSINYHTLSSFCNIHGTKFRVLLQESIALLWKSGQFSPEEVAQDGTRVKANAGGGSLRTEKTLTRYLDEANQYLDKLEKEHKENPSASTMREKTARERAARDRKVRVQQAITEMAEYKSQKVKTAKQNHHKLTSKDLDKMRTSTTDPECRKMKMGDGGFRAAYNVQFATSSDKKVILGVDVVNTLDPGTVNALIQNVHENLGEAGCNKFPKRWLADSAYANKTDTADVEANFPDTTLYSPPTGNGKADALSPRKSDTPAMKRLRERMSTEESQIIYKNRGSTAEFANAVAKNRGMTEFKVRGIKKVKNMAMLYAVVHNMAILFSLIL